MNADLLNQYLPILIFLGIAGAVSAIMIAASWVVVRQKPDREKNTAYECGFDAFGNARGRFDVRFYLVAILFIIFDLEIAFLFPWAISLGAVGTFGFWSMMIFLGGADHRVRLRMEERGAWSGSDVWRPKTAARFHRATDQDEILARMSSMTLKDRRDSSSRRWTSW